MVFLWLLHLQSVFHHQLFQIEYWEFNAHSNNVGQEVRNKDHRDKDKCLKKKRQI